MGNGAKVARKTRPRHRPTGPAAKPDATYFRGLRVEDRRAGPLIWPFARNALTLREQPAAVVGPTDQWVRLRPVFLLNSQRPVLHHNFLLIHFAPYAAIP
jgi:hypothetical protein